MPARSFRTTDSRSRRNTGLLIAAAVGLILAGLVIFVYVQYGSSGPGTPLRANVVDIGQGPAMTGSASDPNQLQASDAARMQFEDKTTPGRLSSELSFDKLDPVGPGYYTLTQPRAWVYLHDGRSLHIRADAGRVKMPSRVKQPESGEFHGNVVVKMFPAPAKGALVNPIDPEKDTPALIAVTESASFDSVLLELTTDDPVQISTPVLLFQGDGLLARGNQVKERLEYLRTHGRFIRYNPNLKSDHESSTAHAGSTPPTAPVQNASSGPAQEPAGAAPAIATVAPPAPATKEQLYKAIFNDSVLVTQTTRELQADMLEVFARLINNQLPDNTFGATSSSSAKTDPAPAQGARVAAGPSSSPTSAPNPTTEDLAALPAAPQSASAAAAVAQKGKPSLFVSAGDEDIILNWTGQLTVVPLGEPGAPAARELAGGNHFAARFTAAKPGGRRSVLMTDSGSPAHDGKPKSAPSRGECAEIEYAATTRTLALLSGPDVARVHFRSSDTGELDAPGLKVDLGTGLANIVGAGYLLAKRVDKISEAALTTVRPDGPIPPPAPPPDPNAPIPPDQLRQITWVDQADFRFRIVNGRMTNALDWAQFKGTVLARDRTSCISGDVLTTDFSAVGTQASAPRHVNVEGKAVVVDGDDKADVDPDRMGPAIVPYVAADRCEVWFEPSKTDPNDVDPVRAIAVGGVRAADKDAALRANRVETILGRDASVPAGSGNPGGVIVTDLLAHGSVVFDRSDGVHARADDLHADPVKRTAELTGEIAAVGRGPSTVLGKRIDLEDATGTMMVYGAGTFEHTQAETNGDTTHVTTTWTKGMAFHNTEGTIQCSGDTKATSVSSLETRVLISERLNLWITPGSVADGKHTDAPATPAGSSEEAAAKPVAAATSGDPLAPGSDRRLLRAEAIGESVDRDAAPHASVQIRRYLPSSNPGEDRVLEQVFYADGPRLLADDVAGTVSIPTAGTAVMMDQHAAAAGTAPTKDTSGTSKFTWGDSMLFTRSTGLLTMNKDVELIHNPLGAAQPTRLVAMRVDATFNNMDPAKPGAGSVTPSSTSSSPGKSDAEKSRSAELVRAKATGAVYVENGPQRLIADNFDYDAQAGTGIAGSLDNSKVTLIDDRTGSQLVARKLFWDLVKDRVEIMEPANIAAPR